MSRRTPLAVAAIVALPVVAASALTGCATAAEAPHVRVSVYQPRTDVAAGRIAIQVHNDEADAVEVRSARLTSEVFAEPADWSGDGTVVPAGRAIDLRVDLPELRCADEADAPRVEVRFADGAVAELEVDDPFDLLDRLAGDACIGEAVRAVAELGPARLDAPGGARPAELVIPVRPVGGEGSFHIDAVLGTTLLRPAIDGVAVGEAPVDVTIEAGGPSEVRIQLVPNRCDAHALAEDKIGTRIPLLITAGDIERSRYVLPADDALRRAMYEFFTEYCGL